MTGEVARFQYTTYLDATIINVKKFYILHAIREPECEHQMLVSSLSQL